MNKALEIAIKKSTHQYGRVWGGCYQPAEIIALCKAGATPNNANSLAYAKKCQKHGKSGTGYFYFSVERSAFKELFGKIKGVRC